MISGSTCNQLKLRIGLAGVFASGILSPKIVVTAKISNPEMEQIKMEGIKMFKDFLKSQNEKDAESQRLIELIRESPYARQLELERDSARVEKQKAPMPKLEALRQQREKELPELRSRVAKAEAEERKLEEALKDARTKRIRAADEESRRSWWFSHQEETTLAEIKSLAPVCVDDFKSELWKLETEARFSVRTEERPTKKHHFTEQYEYRIETNIAAVERRVAAIREARKQAEALKLQPIPETEIAAKLEELKANLPVADEFDVVIVPAVDGSELRHSA